MSHSKTASQLGVAMLYRVDIYASRRNLVEKHWNHLIGPFVAVSACFSSMKTLESLEKLEDMVLEAMAAKAFTMQTLFYKNPLAHTW